jgi:pectinesterase
MDPATPGARSSASAHNTIGLGRPWRPYARVVYISTELPTELNPAGWNNWSNPANESTAFFAESNSTGPGAVTSAVNSAVNSASSSTRVPWSHQLTSAQAAQFRPARFLAGPPSGSAHWNPIAAAAKLP